MHVSTPSVHVSTSLLSQSSLKFPNPFSINGSICSSDLDLDRGFNNIFLPESAAEDSFQFRVDVTNFIRSASTGHITTRPRRTINKASMLRALVEDGSIAMAREATQQDHSDSRMTIITIPQEFSGGTLDITQSAMQELINKLDLPTTFLPVLYAFGSVPRISEAGLDCFTCITHPEQSGLSSFSLTYLYRFIDKDPDSPGAAEDWKNRQIGVFHRHCAITNEDLFIVLQPHPNSQFDGAIEDDVQESIEAMETLMGNPFSLHQLLISLYFVNWREYLKVVADDVSRSSAEAFSQDMHKGYSIDFDFLQSWRNTADNVVPIGATLESVARIVDGLKSIRQKCQHMTPSPNFDVFIQMITSQTTGLGQSARALEKRIENIAELLTNTIETKNQLDAARLNRHIEKLTIESVDDSTSVKIITILSLIYLPGSFVATLFGMNLFVFDSDSRQLEIAKNFWLYAVLFIPLTLFTSGGAWVLSDRTKKRRDERYRSLGLVPPSRPSW